MFSETGARPDVSSWQTGRVTDFSMVFNEIGSDADSNDGYTGPNTLHWNTSSAENFADAFRYCGISCNPPVQNFDVRKVKSFRGMFSGSLNV